MKLVQDWNDHISRELIDPDEKFTVFRQKKKLKECTHILDGLSKWMGSSEHKDCRIEHIIEECDNIATTLTEKLTHNAQNGATALLTNHNDPYQENDSQDADT